MTPPSLTIAGAVLLFTLAILLRAGHAPKGGKELDGEWEMKSVVRGGKEAAADEPKASWTIQGDALTLRVGARSVKVAIKADPSKTPRAIDVTPEEGPHKGEVMKAIYESNGEELRTCHGKPGKDRPTEFASKEEGDVLPVWTPVKK